MTENMELIPPDENRQVTRKVEDALEPDNALQLFREAIAHNATPETMASVMAVRRELRAERAKELFDKALAAFQAECPVIMKSKGVPTADGTTAYKYAPLEDIVVQVKPLLQKHGFSFKIDTDTSSEAGWVIAKCILTHSGGHSEPSTAKFPLGERTRIMSNTQQYAAALTFASRRVFCNALGIVTAGEDMDGRLPGQKPRGPSKLAADPAVQDLARELWSLTAKVGGTARNWTARNQWLWKNEILDPGNPDDAAPHLSAERMREVIGKCRTHPELL